MKYSIDWKSRLVRLKNGELKWYDAKYKSWHPWSARLIEQEKRHPITDTAGERMKADLDRKYNE